ncbi:MAG: OstA-like protein [Chitinophagaceae bacterium]
MMKKYYPLFFTTLFFLVAVMVQGQPTAIPIPLDTSSKLEILPGSGNYSFEKIDSLNTVVTLAHLARIKQDKTLIESDSARVNLNTKIMEAFGNVHINDEDTMNTYSQYIKYFGKERKAILKRAVKLTDSKGGILTTEELLYDLTTKIATYNNGGKMVNKKTVLTSKEAIYYGETKDVIFKKDVVLIDPEYRLAADSLLYNANTEIARFIAPTTIITGTRRIYTRDGFYNLKTKEAYFGNNATIVDSTFSIRSKEMAFDDKTGTAQFKTNVVYTDTAQGIVIMSQTLNSNNRNKTFLATDHPVMILKQDKDSLYITADTLYSGKLTDREKIKNIPVVIDTIKNKRVFDLNGKDSASNRFFEAFHHVRIFSDSMQAVCDSMFYSSTDSAFRLYTRPILWANNSQITGDTIYLFTKNKVAERLYAFENGFIINRVNSSFFNQVKGRTINGMFKDGAIDFIRTKGSAESVYYAQDEANKFIGVNKATADVIDMYFKDKAAHKVVFRNNLKGTTYPIQKITSEELKLRGFNWLDAKRPKTKYELFGN